MIEFITIFKILNEHSYFFLNKMSGSIYSSGCLTNNGEKELFIWPYLYDQIDSISIYIIPISLNPFYNAIK